MKKNINLLLACFITLVFLGLASCQKSDVIDCPTCNDGNGTIDTPPSCPTGGLPPCYSTGPIGGTTGELRCVKIRGVQYAQNVFW